MSEARFKDGTPIHGSLPEAAAIWFLMAMSMGFGVIIGYAAWGHG